jgi:hypothetical protein
LNPTHPSLSGVHAILQNWANMRRLSDDSRTNKYNTKVEIKEEDGRGKSLMNCTNRIPMHRAESSGEKNNASASYSLSLKRVTSAAKQNVLKTNILLKTCCIPVPVRIGMFWVWETHAG